MTLLSIAQSIAQDTKDGQIPTSIVGNNNSTAVQLFSSIKRATKYIARSHDWQALTSTHTFNTANGVSGYDLPSDISGNKIINNSIYNDTTRWKFQGPQSDATWQLYTKGMLKAVGPMYFWQIRQKKFEILPVPTAVESVSYRYIQNTPIESALFVRQTDWLADTDTSILDEFTIELEARWRYLQFKGKPYAEAKLEADEDLRERIAQDKGPGDVYMNTTIPTNGNPMYYYQPLPIAP